MSSNGWFLPSLRYAMRLQQGSEWDDIVKIGRTHMQDATPLTLGQEWSGYAAMLADDLERVEQALPGVLPTRARRYGGRDRINSAPGFAEAATAEIARLTQLPFVSAPNKFAVQEPMTRWCNSRDAAHPGGVSLQDRHVSVALVRPTAGFAELLIPENEPGSSIMPGKVNPTQAEALTMIAVQSWRTISRSALAAREAISR